MSGITVAVTGAAGFLGRALTPVLRDDPAVGSLVAVDLRPGDTTGVEWRTADVRDRSAVAEALRGADVVVHLAAVVVGDTRFSDAINIGGSRNVFEASTAVGARRIVHASSVAAYGYGVDGRLLTEEDELHPIDAFPYSRTKGAAERELDAVLSAHLALETIRLRPAIIVGDNNHDFLENVMHRRGVVKPGRAAGAMQFVHIDDVVEGFRLATLGPATGAFNLAGEGSVSYEDLAALAGKRVATIPFRVAMAGARAAERFRPAMGLGPGWVLIAQRPPFVSSARAENELGWKPAYTSREAVAAFVGAPAATTQLSGGRSR